RAALRFLFTAPLLIPLAALAQTRVPNEFQLTKITRILTPSPDYTVAGVEQFPAERNDQWLAVEVEFAAAPEFTDELTIKYFVLLTGKILTGEVTHTNIAGGRERRSVMYVPPRALARFNNNQAITPNAVRNIAVQIMQRGTVKSELSLARARPQWYTVIANVSGFMLNKNETPFAPLYWDRYEQIKTPGR
ncbi:MAG: Amuc_1102 family pilus-like protein, partial [Verrucomicrobiota bacterium]